MQNNWSLAYIPDDELAEFYGHIYVWYDNYGWLDLGPVAGPVGPEGPQGPLGPEGPEGPTGPQGPQGNDGDDGAPGQSVRLLGYFGRQTTPADLPPDGLIPADFDGAGIPPTDIQFEDSEGLLYLPSDTNDPQYQHVFAYYPDFGQWQDLGNLSGPEGPVGPQGPTGPTGPVGPQGPDGNDGETGPPGEATKLIGTFGDVRTPDELPQDGFIPEDWDGPGRPAQDIQFQSGWSLQYMPADPADPLYQNVYGYYEALGDWSNLGKIAGPEGPEGPQGPIGPEGPQGEIGPEGPQGTQGAAGPQGPEGPQGEQGEVGETINILFSFGISKTPADLPNDGYIPADWDAAGLPPIDVQFGVGQGMIYHPDNPSDPQYNFVYLYQPAVQLWSELGAVAGPEGPAGPAGPEGPEGPTGPQGDTGATGATGPEGPIGPDGPAGADGSQGPPGNTGPQGETGPQGIQGEVGPQGPIGPEGPAGSDATLPAGAVNQTLRNVSGTTYAATANLLVFANGAVNIPNGPLNLGGNNLENIADPTADLMGVNKRYVDNRVPSGSATNLLLGNVRIQSGLATTSTGGGTVTFPAVFGGAPRVVISYANADGTRSAAAAVLTASSSNFTYATVSGSQAIMWIAIGPA
jgi:hypothetical protein